MKLLTSLAAAVVLSGTAVVAQNPPQPSRADGERLITIQGCLKAGHEKDSFVLSNVTERSMATGQAKSPVAQPVHGPVVYWLSTTKGMSDHVGHTIDVTGRLDPTEPKKAEIEVKNKPDGTKVAEIEGPGLNGGQVKTAPSNVPNGAAVASHGQKEVGLPTTVYRLKVESLKHVAEGCKP